LKKLEGHSPDHDSSGVRAAFSPDGKKVITGSIDGTARIWDLSAKEKL
jgi:WD40 repeat protein